MIHFRFYISCSILAALILVDPYPISASQEAAVFEPPTSITTVQTTDHGRTNDIRKTSRMRIGIASWYSRKEKSVKKHTANGELFNDQAMTCASWKYPFGTKLRVTNLDNGRSVVVRVNDRGPAKRLSRAIDLSKRAFSRIARTREGLIEVAIQPVN